MIKLNIANAMEELIGEKGLTERELEDIKELLLKAHRELTERKWQELAFLDLPEHDLTSVLAIAEEVRLNSDTFLVLGIGGSALGPRAILEALSPFHNLYKSPKIFIYDNVDPITLNAILELVDLKKSYINVITKSGSTAETIASFMILWDKMHRAIGEQAKERFIATTDPSKGNLRQISEKFNLKTLPIAPGIVGRYSVLSPVGLLLTEVAGISSKELLKGAKEIRDIILRESELWKNPALLMAGILYLLGTKYGKTIHVLVPYADGLKSFSEWFCQLWAESLGKLGLGFTPYPSVGTTDQHSQLQLWMEGPEDKVVIFIRIEDYGVDYKIPIVFEEMEGLNYLSGHLLSELIKAEQESTELALAKAGRPNVTLKIPRIDPYYLGQLFMFFEIVTALVGFLLGINPFNQPGVEEGKNFTYGMMGKKGYEEKRQEVDAARQKKSCWEL